VLAHTVVHDMPEPTGVLAMLGGGPTPLFARRRKAASTVADPGDPGGVKHRARLFLSGVGQDFCFRNGFIIYS
jgi:hypothetical protein